MDFSIRSLRKRRQSIIAIAAAGLLVGILTPLQTATAAFVEFEFEDEEFQRPGAYAVSYDVELGALEEICNPVSHEFSPGTRAAGDQVGTIDYLTETFTSTLGTRTPQSLISNVNVIIEFGLYGEIDGDGCIVGPAEIDVSFSLATAFLPPGTQTLTVDINGDHDTQFDIVT